MYLGVILSKETLISTWKPIIKGEKLIVKQIMINKRILHNCVIEVNSKCQYSLAFNFSRKLSSNE